MTIGEEDYLVAGRGIEASRFTARSVAAIRPPDPGTDAAAQGRNRRVEVWFVPEGATVPEQHPGAFGDSRRLETDNRL